MEKTGQNAMRSNVSNFNSVRNKYLSRLPDKAHIDDSWAVEENFEGPNI